MKNLGLDHLTWEQVLLKIQKNTSTASSAEIERMACELLACRSLLRDLKEQTFLRIDDHADIADLLEYYEKL